MSRLNDQAGRWRPGVRVRQESGFSVVEIVFAVAITFILTTLAVYNLGARKKLMAQDLQAIQVKDFMNDAATRALTMRRGFRVQVDYTDGKLLLIDENGSGPGDDTLAREVLLTGDVKTGPALPTGLNATGLPNYSALPTETDEGGYRNGSGNIISGHQVWTARFRSDGTVTNRQGVVSSGTLYLWPPKSAEEPNRPGNNSLVRAITVFGPGGGIKLWRYNGTQFANL